MTTTVKVSAYCSEDKEVIVTLDSHTTKLQDGESREFFVYGDKHINVKEIIKETENNLLTELEDTVVNWALAKNKVVGKLGQAKMSSKNTTLLALNTTTKNKSEVINQLLDKLEQTYTDCNSDDIIYFTFFIFDIVDIDGSIGGIYFEGYLIKLVVSFD